MSQEDITQIRINKSTIGIIGLKSVLEDMAEGYRDKPDTEVLEELLHRLGKKNYIPEKVKRSYAAAFLREFKKFMGRPYEEESPEGIEIKVLGAGCVGCDMLERELMEVLAEMDLAASLEHVTDIKQIGEYGVMGTPALIINGKVVSVGSIPPKNQIMRWLQKAGGKTS